MIGWSEQNSTPPAMATSAWPVWIRLMHEVTAWFAEMHAIVTVWPGVDKGNPGKSTKKVKMATCGEGGLLGNVGCANLLLDCASTRVVNL